MKVKILLVNAIAMLSFLLLFSISYGQWLPLNSGTERNLYSVNFPETLTGYAVGDSGIILKTSDGGENWETSYYGQFSEFQSVFFNDALIGYTAGISIRKTTNGGSSWINQYSSPSSPLNSMLLEFGGDARQGRGGVNSVAKKIIQLFLPSPPSPYTPVFSRRGQARRASAHWQGIRGSGSWRKPCRAAHVR